MRKDTETGLLRFTDFLYLEKGLSLNTVKSYKSDLSLFISYLESRGVDPQSVQSGHVIDYLSFCSRTGLSSRTVSRYMSSIRALFRFLINEGITEKDPTVGLSRPKPVKNPPEYLTIEEVEILLDMPNEKTVLGLRDKTIMELLYSCGLRISEVVQLQVNSVNFDEGLILVQGKGKKERIVPFGKRAERLLYGYLDTARGTLQKMKSLALSELPGRNAVKKRPLENDQRVCETKRDHEAYQAAYTTSLICDTSHTKRRGPPHRTGAFRAFGHFHHPNIHAP
jgi:integrase/recombinase XerD